MLGSAIIEIKDALMICYFMVCILLLDVDDDRQDHIQH
jgi:hypothetical protein